MKDITIEEVRMLLENVQGKAKTHLAYPEDAHAACLQMERFLKASPKGTQVKACFWERFSDNKFHSEATYIFAEKKMNGHLKIAFHRGPHGFCKRGFVVYPPNGFRVEGPHWNVHFATGAVFDLDCCEIVEK